MRKTVSEIHRNLKKTHPHISNRIKHHFRYKYPKLTFLAVTIVFAYFIFRNPSISESLASLDNLSYLGIFVAGLLFSYGFTTPFAVGLFVTIEPANIFLAALIGGIGAYLSDFTIFSIIKNSFMDEFNSVENTKSMKKFRKLINESLNKKIKIYLLYVTAGLIIASPLPDEFGVALLAGIGHIKPIPFSIISFICNTLGILAMLLF